MPEFTKEEYNQYKQNIIDTGKANNQIGYLYEFYLDNKDNMRFLKTKCYFVWNNQVVDLFKRKSVDGDLVHIIYKDSFGLYDRTCHTNKVNSTNSIFLLEENDELARQMIMKKLEERKLKIIDQMSTLSSITLETSKTNDRFDTM